MQGNHHQVPWEGEAGSPPWGRLLCRRLSSAERETVVSLQMHIKSLPWRRKRANTTKNMQKINSLVRSGLATSFSFRHLALLWEALIIFYCFTHSQKYDETRTECVFFFCLLTVSTMNYSPTRLNCISYSKGASFCLQGLRPQTLPGLAMDLRAFQPTTARTHGDITAGFHPASPRCPGPNCAHGGTKPR